MIERACRYCLGALAGAASHLSDSWRAPQRIGHELLATARRALGRVLSRFDVVGLGPRFATEHAGEGSKAEPPRSERRSDVCTEARIPTPMPRVGRLPRLEGQPKLHGTVWLPRLLWALEWAERSGSAPATAAQLAEIYTREGGFVVAGPNVARAFRELRSRPEVARLWLEPEPLLYRISEEGHQVLTNLLRSNAS